MRHTFIASLLLLLLSGFSANAQDVEERSILLGVYSVRPILTASELHETEYRIDTINSRIAAINATIDSIGVVSPADTTNPPSYNFSLEIGDKKWSNLTDNQKQYRLIREERKLLSGERKELQLAVDDNKNHYWRKLLWGAIKWKRNK